jgi:hypothetical protein
MKKVERWKVEMPTEQEMLPKDKYTVFDRKVKRYRKGIHSKWFPVFWGGIGFDGWETDFGFGEWISDLEYGIWDIANDSEQRCQSGRE